MWAVIIPRRAAILTAYFLSVIVQAQCPTNYVFPYVFSLGDELEKVGGNVEIESYIVDPNDESVYLSLVTNSYMYLHASETNLMSHNARLVTRVSSKEHSIIFARHIPLNSNFDMPAVAMAVKKEHYSQFAVTYARLAKCTSACEQTRLVIRVFNLDGSHSQTKYLSPEKLNLEEIVAVHNDLMVFTVSGHIFVYLTLFHDGAFKTALIRLEIGSDPNAGAQLAYLTSNHLINTMAYLQSQGSAIDITKDVLFFGGARMHEKDGVQFLTPFVEMRKVYPDSARMYMFEAKYGADIAVSYSSINTQFDAGQSKEIYSAIEVVGLAGVQNQNHYMIKVVTQAKKTSSYPGIDFGSKTYGDALSRPLIFVPYIMPFDPVSMTIPYSPGQEIVHEANTLPKILFDSTDYASFELIAGGNVRSTLIEQSTWFIEVTNFDGTKEIILLFTSYNDYKPHQHIVLRNYGPGTVLYNRNWDHFVKPLNEDDRLYPFVMNFKNTETFVDGSISLKMYKDAGILLGFRKSATTTCMDYTASLFDYTVDGVPSRSLVNDQRTYLQRIQMVSTDAETVSTSYISGSPIETPGLNIAFTDEAGMTTSEIPDPENKFTRGTRKASYCELYYPIYNAETMKTWLETQPMTISETDTSLFLDGEEPLAYHRAFPKYLESAEVWSLAYQDCISGTCQLSSLPEGACGFVWLQNQKFDLEFTDFFTGEPETGIQLQLVAWNELRYSTLPLKTYTVKVTRSVELPNMPAIFFNEKFRSLTYSMEIMRSVEDADCQNKALYMIASNKTDFTTLDDFTKAPYFFFTENTAQFYFAGIQHKYPFTCAISSLEVSIFNNIGSPHQLFVSESIAAVEKHFQGLEQYPPPEQRPWEHTWRIGKQRYRVTVGHFIGDDLALFWNEYVKENTQFFGSKAEYPTQYNGQLDLQQMGETASGVRFPIQFSVNVIRCGLTLDVDATRVSQIQAEIKKKFVQSQSGKYLLYAKPNTALFRWEFDAYPFCPDCGHDFCMNQTVTGVKIEYRSEYYSSAMDKFIPSGPIRANYIQETKKQQWEFELTLAVNGIYEMRVVHVNNFKKDGVAELSFEYSLCIHDSPCTAEWETTSRLVEYSVENGITRQEVSQLTQEFLSAKSSQCPIADLSLVTKDPPEMEVTVKQLTSGSYQVIQTYPADMKTTFGMKTQINLKSSMNCFRQVMSVDIVSTIVFCNELAPKPNLDLTKQKFVLDGANSKLTLAGITGLAFTYEQGKPQCVPQLSLVRDNLGADAALDPKWEKMIVLKEDTLLLNFNTLLLAEELQFFVKAQVGGSAIMKPAYQKFTISLIEKNDAPSLKKKDILTLQIVVQESEQQQGYTQPVETFSTNIMNPEQEEMTLKVVSIDNPEASSLIPCDCLSIIITLEALKQPLLYVSIDKSQITAADEGLHQFKLSISDSNNTSEYPMKVAIQYVEAGESTWVVPVLPTVGPQPQGKDVKPTQGDGNAGKPGGGGGAEPDASASSNPGSDTGNRPTPGQPQDGKQGSLSNRPEGGGRAPGSSSSPQGNPPRTEKAPNEAREARLLQTPPSDAELKQMDRLSDLLGGGGKKPAGKDASDKSGDGKPSGKELKAKQDKEEKEKESLEAVSGDGESLQMEVPPWKNVASDEEIEAEWQDWKLILLREKALLDEQASTSDQIEPEEPKEPEISLKAAARNGTLTFYFSEKLVVPRFARKASSLEGSEAADRSRRRRQLVGLDTIDIQRDIFDVSFVLKSDIHPSRIKYFIEIIEWTEEAMEIFVNFTDPLLISQGMKDDLMVLTVKNPLLFVSKESLRPIPERRLSLLIEMPRQFPKGVDPQAVQESAENAKTSLMIVMLIQIGLQLVLKGMMDDLWSLYFTLQFIVYLRIYKIAIPSNIELFLLQLKDLIEFRALSLDGGIKLFWGEGMTAQKLLFSVLGVEESPQELMARGSTIIEELQVYIAIAFIALVSLLAAGLLMIFKRFRPKIKKKLKQVRKKMIWSGAIRSLLLSYFQTCLMAQSKLVFYFLYFDKPKVRNDDDLLTGVVALSLALAVPFLLVKVLIHYKYRTDSPNFQKKFEILSKDVYVGKKKNPWLVTGVWMYPLLFFRRWMFCVVPILFLRHSYFQFQALAILTLFFSSSYFKIKPALSRRRLRLEQTNEVFLSLLVYHLVVFTDFNLDVSLAFNVGYSFLLFLAAMLVLNVINIVFNVVVQVKAKREFIMKKTVFLSQVGTMKLTKFEKWVIQWTTNSEFKTRVKLNIRAKHKLQSMNPKDEKQLKKKKKRKASQSSPRPERQMASDPNQLRRMLTGIAIDEEINKVQSAVDRGEGTTSLQKWKILADSWKQGPEAGEAHDPPSNEEDEFELWIDKRLQQATQSSYPRRSKSRELAVIQETSIE